MSFGLVGFELMTNPGLFAHSASNACGQEEVAEASQDGRLVYTMTGTATCSHRNAHVHSLPGFLKNISFQTLYKSFNLLVGMYIVLPTLNPFHSTVTELEA